MFWVYVLENARGTFYVGQTENIAQRVTDHNRTDCFEGHFTRKNGRGNSFGGRHTIPAVLPCNENDKSSG